jgi:hypothetical protein
MRLRLHLCMGFSCLLLIVRSYHDASSHDPLKLAMMHLLSTVCRLHNPHE